MRRGPSGIGGWRNENPRHFRPRNGGNQHFRSSRGYGLLDPPSHRFPPPISRPHRPSLPYKHRSDSNVRTRLDHHDRSKYRMDHRPSREPEMSYPRNQDESHQPQDKHIFSMSRPTRSTETAFNHSSTYPPDPSNYYEDVNKHCHMNSMGDIDDRYVPPRETFKQNTMSPWASENIFNKYGERVHTYEHNKTNRYNGGESSKLPLYDYTGHRPPSNDHYGGNPTPVINNSGSFNRSVDDTVDLIRKRLLNRSEPHIETNDNFPHNPIEIPKVKKAKESIQNFNQEQPSKKKANRHRRSSKSSNDTSFTKIKSKIVNQLFKMDKEKIHKLMDNPNSSSKFEYAISSLITESQYSFNRHLRSVAEKSLHTSSSIDFIQNDNNTIYEDTFMKQMQCILDPQDTVLLEDIKPIVMAELSKALQLDEYDQQYEMGDDEPHQQRYGHPNYENEIYDEEYAFDDYATSFSNISDQKFPISQIAHTQYTEETNVVHNQDNDKNHSTSCDTNDPIFEIQTRRRSNNLSPERVMTLESPQYTRKSLDDRLNELFSANTHSNSENPEYNSEPDSPHLFVPNAEPLEDEDDPFAELDKQYHVAVDHSFIDNDDSSSINMEKNYVKPPSPNTPKNITLSLNTPEKASIKQEIDHQLQDMANSPLKLPSYVNSQNKAQISTEKKELPPARDNRRNCDNSLTTPANLEKSTCSKTSGEIERKEVKKEIEVSDTPHIITIGSASASRKRSIDQSPSHRKEKRKKSSSISYDSDKQIQSKGMLVANENFSKMPKKEHDKQSLPEKQTKRKENLKKTDQKTDELSKKNNSTEIFSAGVSHKESHNTNTGKSHIKTEAKTTLKTFDLFTEQPKKAIVHHAHRNTALPPTNIIKSNSELKPTSSEPKSKKPNKTMKKNLPVQIGTNMHSVQIQTIEIRNTCSRFSQTDRKKLVSKATQTNLVTIATNQKDTKARSTDPLERMKEIDMEIQLLLQEKFKLYSSIESKDSDKKSLHTLGMALVVEEEIQDNSGNTSEENASTEDSIVDDFTNIPADELEQIALESIETKEIEDPKPLIRSKRLKVLEREKSKSQSPTPINQRKNNRKIRTPNISLIEEIISDERPLEDIISLEDLEHTPVKSRSKNNKSKRNAKKKSAKPVEKPLTPIDTKDIKLKDCSVLLIREDFSKYFPVKDTEDASNVTVSSEPVETVNQIINDSNHEQNNVQDDPIVNDLHFDMLDVSEDIVIGDNCEIKSLDDKEELSITDIPISEDIILDNSQSSLEETQGSTSDPKENECKMFDFSADENLRRDSVVVTGNADAVLAVECIENNFIAACLDGNVYYFSGDGQLITTLRGSNLAVTCLTIVKEKYGTTVYTGSLDSRIRYYDLDTGLEKGPECNVLSPIQTMDRAWDTVFVGTRTGFVLQFECKNNMLIPISTVQFSDQSILALRAMKEGARKVLLVAARSEDVTIKDAQTGLLLRTLAGPKMTVYTLLYEDGKIYCGTSSSQIHVFDYSSGSHVGAHEGGKGAVCLRASGGLLFAGCYDGCVYVYREGERRPFAQLRGPSLMLLSLAVVGSKIIAGYKDRSLYIWKIPLSILQEMIL